MTTQLVIEGRHMSLEIRGRRPKLRMRIDGRDHEIVEARGPDGSFEIVVDGISYRGFRFITPDAIWVRFGGRTFVSERSADAKKTSPTGKLEVRSEMPGTVVAIHVEEGAGVRAGDALLTVESMKLQLTLHADRTGSIAKIFSKVGATFDRGAPLLAYRAEIAKPDAPVLEPK